MKKISKRLETAAGLVSDGNVLADVGTDHGYVPIYLVEQGRIPRAVAMDINQGPLKRAKEHIRAHQLENYIETRLSDGVEALAPGEADTILIAGMGGGLIMHILDAGEDVCKKAGELILQPQSELEKVRHFLAEQGYVIETEEMVKEDGKYYPMMRVHYREGEKEKPDALSCIYGPVLLKMRHPILHEFLEREKHIYEGILADLKRQPQTEPIRLRMSQVEAALEKNCEALQDW